MTEEETSELTAIFSDEGTVNPFKDLGTLYRQEKFIEKNFNCVVSIAQHFAELGTISFYLASVLPLGRSA